MTTKERTVVFNLCVIVFNIVVGLFVELIVLLGLMFFLIGAGVAGGASFVKYFQWVYFIYGIIMTLVPMIVGYLFAKYVLRLSLLNNLGSITGGMTSTPALGTLIQTAGTENVAGIVGMATALKEHCDHLTAEAAYLSQLIETLLYELSNTGLDFIVNGANHRLPGSLSVSFKDADGEMLMHRLDLMGTAVATGSACNSKDTVRSHVISAIGVPNDYAHGTIRVTLGMDNTIDQISVMAEQIRRVLDK
mgnify:CR=1 FL=1